ncbi:tetratricopeptide repeat protein [Sphingomonas sp. NIBR02145]|uniref:tetratricopeptide repeat protein n=1 Tax=Sphingomonas sp. NIBR02145 TaxID=3014784 RepID=UPI0022B477E5|nr:tetratricopeptide repeat protein [Sphingomonas sp. NIBR02145]WHU04989.1 tetratricopeptide repeat protein [Sphingomonas sp. NIBR02145]
MTEQTAAATSRYLRLADLLGQDPDNLALLADTAEAAFAEERFEAAQALLDRQSLLAPLAPQGQHLAGLIAMRRMDWPRAAEIYQTLLASGNDAPPVRFNLAWSLAMAKRFEEALAALDEPASLALPQAAQLEVQLLHQLGMFDRALERARALIEIHPDHRGLNAIISTLAIDMEDSALALRTAEKAGDHPDALTTLGTLALGEDDPDTAAQLFEAALARAPEAPRAWVGRGLTRLLGDDKAAAAADLDKGADMFGTHLGSWIAAGWAHALAGDRATARARFEKALALDDTFGEAQGSLAVIELLDGQVEEAKRRTEVALRLDRDSFSGALAAMLLAAGEGKPDRAARIFETALRTPIGENGKTLAQALARLGAR